MFARHYAESFGCNYEHVHVGAVWLQDMQALQEHVSQCISSPSSQGNSHAAHSLQFSSAANTNQFEALNKLLVAAGQRNKAAGPDFTQEATKQREHIDWADFEQEAGRDTQQPALSLVNIPKLSPDMLPSLPQQSEQVLQLRQMLNVCSPYLQILI